VKRRWPLEQTNQTGQLASRAVIDVLPLLQATLIEHKLLTIGQHALGGEAPLIQEERASVSADGGCGTIEQFTIALRRPQLNATGFDGLLGR